jgi:hypothetical protein
MPKAKTLRDYFAAKALQGMLANTQFSASKEAYANTAYEYADAMLRQRQEKTDGR